MQGISDSFGATASKVTTCIHTHTYIYIHRCIFTLFIYNWIVRSSAKNKLSAKVFGLRARHLHRRLLWGHDLSQIWEEQPPKFFCCIIFVLMVATSQDNWYSRLIFSHQIQSTINRKRQNNISFKVHCLTLLGPSKKYHFIGVNKNPTTLLLGFGKLWGSPPHM